MYIVYQKCNDAGKNPDSWGSIMQKGSWFRLSKVSYRKLNQLALSETSEKFPLSVMLHFRMFWHCRVRRLAQLNETCLAND